MPACDPVEIIVVLFNSKCRTAHWTGSSGDDGPLHVSLGTQIRDFGIIPRKGIPPARRSARWIIGAGPSADDTDDLVGAFLALGQATHQGLLHLCVLAILFSALITDPI